MVFDFAAAGLSIKAHVTALA